MNPEQAKIKTLEQTSEVLEYYSKYLTKSLDEKFNFNPNSNFKSYSFFYKVTPTYYDYDAVFYLNQKRILHVEVKVRTDISSDTYKESKIPLRKHAVALYYFQSLKIKTHYLALFQDGLYKCDIHINPQTVIEMPNRWDRGGEINEYAMYKISNFELIG